MSIQSFPVSLFLELQQCESIIVEKKQSIVQYISEYLKKRDGGISFYPDNKPDISQLLFDTKFQRPKATAYFSDGSTRHYDVHIVRLATKDRVEIILNDGSWIFDIEKELKIEQLISLISAIVRYDAIVNK